MFHHFSSPASRPAAQLHCASTTTDFSRNIWSTTWNSQFVSQQSRVVWRLLLLNWLIFCAHDCFPRGRLTRIKPRPFCGGCTWAKAQTKVGFESPVPTHEPRTIYRYFSNLKNSGVCSLGIHVECLQTRTKPPVSVALWVKQHQRDRIVELSTRKHRDELWWM